VESSTNDRPLAVGDMLHGYCGGMFGRDHLRCARVEAFGGDWAVVRNALGHLSFASGAGITNWLRDYREPEGGTCDWCGDWDND
jgi:hypothetical protein